MGRRILTGLLLVPVLLFCLALALSYSAMGARYVVVLLDESTDLELEYAGGSLLGGLQLARLRVPTGAAIVELDDVNARVTADCLWQGSICLEYLQVGYLDIEVPLGAPDAGGEESPLWPLPVAISSDQIAIAQLRVHWGSDELRGSAIAGSARVYGERVHVYHASARGVQLAISGKEASEPGPLVLPDFELPVKLRVDKLTLSDSGWMINGLANYYRELEVRGLWEGAELKLDSLSLVNDEWGRAVVQGDVRFLHPYSLRAQVEYRMEQPPLWQGLHDSTGRMALAGTLVGLQLEVDHCGPIAAALTGTLDLLGSGVPFELEAKGGCRQQDAEVVLSALPGLESAPAVHLGGDWVLRARGDLDVQQLELAATAKGYELPALQVTGRGRLSGETHLHIDRLQLDPLDLPGQQIVLDGDLDLGERVSWVGDVTLSQLRLPLPLQFLEGDLSGVLRSTAVFSAGDWHVAIDASDLQGSLNGRPLSVRGQLQLDQDLLTAGTSLQINSSTDRLTLADDGRGLPRARLTVADLGDGVGGAQGSLHADAQWNANQQRLGIEAAAQWPGWSALRARELVVTADVGLAGGLDTRVSAVLNQALLGENRLELAELELSGSESSHRLTVRTSGDVSASLELLGGRDDAGWRGQLAPTVLQLPAGSWRLDVPVELEFDSIAQQLALADHCWQGEGAKICARDTLLGVSGATSLEMEGELQDLDDILPARYSLSGSVAALLHAGWRDLQPTEVDASLRFGRGRLIESRPGQGRSSYAWDSLSLDYQADASAGQLSGALMRGGRAQISVDLELPPRLDGSLSGEMLLNEFELGELRPLLARVGRLEGLLQGSLRFSGTVSEPEIHGGLALRQGLISMAGNPTEVEQVDVQLDFQGKHADLSGQLRVGDGTSRLAGALRWMGDPELTIAMQGGRKPLLYPTDTVIHVAEDIELSISSESIRLAGEVVVLDGELVLDDIPASAVEVSEDVVLLDYTGRETRAATGSPVDMALQVQVADTLGFRMEGIEAVLGGELSVLKAPREPLLLMGRLNLRRGHFELLGPRFDVTRGQVSFVGAAANPELDIAMEREITEDQVTVGIRVTGNAQMPELEFYSRPALPEAEVMAYALSGRGVDRQGSGDGLGLAVAMTSGLLQSSGALSGLSLGVEGKDSSTRAVIGGYVSDRIYLSYGVGVYEPVNTLTVRLDVLHSLWMEVVSSLKSSADMYYSWSTR